MPCVYMRDASDCLICTCAQFVYYYACVREYCMYVCIEIHYTRGTLYMMLISQEHIIVCVLCTCVGECTLNSVIGGIYVKFGRY